MINSSLLQGKSHRNCNACGARYPGQSLHRGARSGVCLMLQMIWAVPFPSFHFHSLSPVNILIHTLWSWGPFLLGLWRICAGVPYIWCIFQHTWYFELSHQPFWKPSARCCSPTLWKQTPGFPHHPFLVLNQQQLHHETTPQEHERSQFWRNQ